MGALLRYSVGIDVGARSIGFCAVEVDESGMPRSILNAMVLSHDGGLDPDGHKAAVTRLAVSGIARRTRRRIQRNRKRLAELDEMLAELGWLPAGQWGENDPYFPWRARAELTQGFVADEVRRKALLGIAIRHIARHRGWRSPYMKTAALLRPAEDSPQLRGLRERVAEIVGVQAAAELRTQAELVAAVGLEAERKVRGPEGVLQGKLMQSDNANELRLIAEQQHIDSEVLRRVVLQVFKAKSPRGSVLGRVGKDPLPGQGEFPRAEKAQIEFQRYRIAALIGNLRIREARELRALTHEERDKVYAFLNSAKAAKGNLSWDEVAGVLGIAREHLRGTATPTADGDRAAARPPIDATQAAIMGSKIKPLIQWWEQQDDPTRAGLIRRLSNSAGAEEPSTAEEMAAEEFLATLDDASMEKLEGLTLPVGRVAYSTESLVRLTHRMLVDGVDLHEARKREFGVSDDWRPPAPSIGEQTGNPSVDRVLKAVARWLGAAEREWGVPQSVNIEHVREGFMSESKARELDREMDNRAKQNQKVVEQYHAAMGTNGIVRRSDRMRYMAFVRQNAQCLYCGSSLEFRSMEMDHIVPRAGVGATNRRDNLAAVCRRCNASKSKHLFSAWAERCGIPGVSVKEAIERVRMWARDPGDNPKSWANFTREVILRLKRTTADPEIDGRSMESIAWMANELRQRIEQHWYESDVTVRVFRGQLTAEARRASGLEQRIPFIGGSGKTRLDRRHHAMDAACVAMMRMSVAKTLVQRANLRDQQRIERAPETWKEWQGEDNAAKTIWSQWMLQMHKLAELFSIEIERDRIPVMENLRLRLGNGSAHDDTIRRLDTRKRVGDELSQADMDRASTPALWTALSRAPGFELGKGLPADEHRMIRVNGTRMDAADELPLFSTKSTSILVRGGGVEIGGAIHHARIYRIRGKKDSYTYGMVRVFAHDLLRQQREDLFNVELPAQSVSVRDAAMSMRKALAENQCEYVGWLVPGDEILVDIPSKLGTTAVDLFLQDFPETRRWRVQGFFSETRLRLRPSQLASEGLPPEAPAHQRKTLELPGWICAVNVLFSNWNPTIIRRDSLGRVRLHGGRSRMPISWRSE